LKTIRTARLRLAPVTPQNATVLWSLLQSDGLREYQDLPTVSQATFNGMVQKRPKTLVRGASGRFEWLIYRHHGRRPLGWVSLRVAEREPAAGEIGYSILPDFRGSGLATEAVTALIDEAFLRTGLARLTAFCVPANLASRRVLSNLAFDQGTLVRHGASVRGASVDVLRHVLTRQAWQNAQSANSMDIPASA